MPNIFIPRRVIFFLVCLLLVMLSSAQAQVPLSNRSLYDQLALMDSALFQTFNTCDLSKNGTFFTEDLEFYHDKSGLAVSRQKLVESLENMCRQPGRPKRELVKGSLRVYPIANYGAVQVGIHRFYEVTDGQEKPGSIAKFIHLWNNKNGGWKISRVLSYDHRLPQSSDPSATLELYNKIYSLDSALFESFNTCDLDKNKTFFTSDFELYDARSGLNTSREKEVISFRNRCAGQTKLRRELVKGSLAVYPLAGYGAIQIGDHRFYSTEKGQQEKLVEDAKFIHVWQEKRGEWKLTRVISYDHRKRK